MRLKLYNRRAARARRALDALMWRPGMGHALARWEWYTADRNRRLHAYLRRQDEAEAERLGL